jgi:hypothetical protein
MVADRKQVSGKAMSVLAKLSSGARFVKSGSLLASVWASAPDCKRL